MSLGEMAHVRAGDVYSTMIIIIIIRLVDCVWCVCAHGRERLLRSRELLFARRGGMGCESWKAKNRKSLCRVNRDLLIIRWEKLYPESRELWMFRRGLGVQQISHTVYNPRHRSSEWDFCLCSDKKCIVIANPLYITVTTTTTSILFYS